MTENEIYTQILRNLLEYLENGKAEIGVNVSSYILGVMDTLMIIREKQESEA